VIAAAAAATASPRLAATRWFRVLALWSYGKLVALTASVLAVAATTAAIFARAASRHIT